MTRFSPTAYLRSLVIDHDLDFTNDYLLLYAPATDADAASNVWLTSTTPVGRRTNQMSIGPALLWAPFFIATCVALVLLRPLGVIVPIDGIAAPFPLSAGVAGVVYATLGAYFCYRACLVLVPRRAAFWGRDGGVAGVAGAVTTRWCRPRTRTRRRWWRRRCSAMCG